MGKTGLSHASAGANIRAWAAEMDGEGLDAVIINTSGCGTTVKDYGYMFRDDPELAGDAARVSAITRDITEFMAEVGLGTGSGDRSAPALRVAYHSACSLQHGQKVTEAPKALLRQAGFEVVEPAEGHLCCGSAGTYNLLQPKISAELKARKVRNIEATRPQLIAAGNIGCMMQIGSATGIPVVHTAELLDWATGGPEPAALAGRIAAD
jgi:glycolate oxidase iron-sulfur subunit